MKLTEVIAHYGALRQAMGERFDSAESVLQTFCRQMEPDIDIEDIHADRVAAFLAGTGPVTRYWHRKHGVLRGLYTYAISRGVVAASPLPTIVPKLPPPLCPACLHARRTQSPRARHPVLPAALSQTGAPHTAHDDPAALWCRPPRERSRRLGPWGRGLTQRPAHRTQHEIS